MTHEFVGEDYAESPFGPTVAEEISGAEYDGWPLKQFSHEAIMAQQGICNYVWPNEGRWKGKRFIFKRKPKDAKEGDVYPARPLMVDGSSARAYQVCFPTMNEKNQDGCKAKCESKRWWFGYILSEVFWANVSYGAKR